MSKQLFKGTGMQIKKALLNNRLSVSKYPENSAVIYP